MRKITAKTICINDILLNSIENICETNQKTRNEIIRKAVGLYLLKVRKLFEHLDKDSKRYRSDKKQTGNLNIITIGLLNTQFNEIDSLIPGFASSNSEFIRIAILDFLVNNPDLTTQTIQSKEKEPMSNDNKIRVPIGLGLYKEYTIVKR